MTRRSIQLISPRIPGNQSFWEPRQALLQERWPNALGDDQRSRGLRRPGPEDEAWQRQVLEQSSCPAHPKMCWQTPQTAPTGDSGALPTYPGSQCHIYTHPVKCKVPKAPVPDAPLHIHILTTQTGVVTVFNTYSPEHPPNAHYRAP